MRAHDAAARGPRRRAEDVEVARQLRGDRRAAGGAVRQAHVAARRAHAPLLHAHHRLAPRPHRRGHRRAGRRGAARRSTPSACWPARSSTCTTARARARRPRPSSTGCSGPTTRPTTIAEFAIPTPTSCATAGSALARAARARVPGRGAVEQGGRAARSSRAACASTARWSPTPTLDGRAGELDGVILQVGKRNWARSGAERRDRAGGLGASRLRPRSACSVTIPRSGSPMPGEWAQNQKIQPSSETPTMATSTTTAPSRTAQPLPVHARSCPTTSRSARVLGVASSPPACPPWPGAGEACPCRVFFEPLDPMGGETSVLPDEKSPAPACRSRAAARSISSPPGEPFPGGLTRTLLAGPRSSAGVVEAEVSVGSALAGRLRDFTVAGVPVSSGGSLKTEQ